MPTTADAPHPTLAPVDLVDFKWLMAGEGHRIDPQRLQRDTAYARGCIALATHSTTPTLRLAAQRVARALGLPGG